MTPETIVHVIELALLALIAFSKVFEKLLEKLHPSRSISDSRDRRSNEDIKIQMSELRHSLVDLDKVYLRRDVADEKFKSLNDRVDSLTVHVR